MNRRLADRLAVVGVAILLLAGGWSAWQASQASPVTGGMMDGGMMGGGMDGVGTVDPLWYVLGTVVAVAVLGAAYVVVREDLTTVPGSREAVEEQVSASAAATRSEAADGTRSPTADGDATPGAAAGARRLLDLLPDDERRVLEPVIESPGITQIELRDRSAFSKSKVSQTVTALEKRGLLYRERQGRTFRVYPDDSLDDA